MEWLKCCGQAGSSSGTGSSGGIGGGGGRANQYQYYSSQSLQQPSVASQQHLTQYYTGSQVMCHI